MLSLITRIAARTPRLQDLDNKLLNTCSTEGSIKSPLHVCPSYSSAFFFQKLVISFFLIFCRTVDNWNIQTLIEPPFPGKFIFPQIGNNGLKMAPKNGFLDFLKNFVCNNPK